MSFLFVRGFMREHRRRVKKLMERPLPTLTEQRQLVYRPGLLDASRAYNLLNQSVFGAKLIKPEIEICRLHGGWGECIGVQDTDGFPYCTKIRLNDKFYSIQWFITVLAHEMAHQYQWEVQGAQRVKQGLEPIMSHGKSFFEHKEKLSQIGIYLKTTYRSEVWFETQNLFKC